MRKIVSVILILALCLSLLTGCGSSRIAADPQPEQKAEVQTAEPVQASAKVEKTAAPTGQMVYQSSFIELQDVGLTAAIQHMVNVGDKIFFTSLGVLEDRTPEGVTPEWPEQYWVYGPVLCRAELDGTVTKLPYQTAMPAETESGSQGVIYENLFPGENGTLWILENHYRTGDAAEQAAMEEHRKLVCIREDGGVVAEFPLDHLCSPDIQSDPTGDYSFDLNGLVTDKDGNLCIAIHEWYSGGGSYAQMNRICEINGQTGEVLKTIRLNTAPEYLVSFPDGEIAVSYYRGATPVIGFLDLEAEAVQDAAQIDDFLNGLISTQNGHTVYYSAGDSLYRMDLDAEESEKLFDWTGCDVARSGNESVCLLENGSVLTATGKSTAGGVRNELVLITPKDSSQIPEKKVLKMAVTNLYPFTSEMVSRFNRNSSEYRIELVDYSQYNNYTSGNPEDWNAGTTRLQTEIIAGNIPDILDISLLPVGRLGAKGLLEDLYPYIDADPEFGRSNLNEHVLGAFEENGKLFQTVGNYYVLTTAGLSQVVGDKMGWTMQDFNAAMSRLQAEHPESTVFDLYTTRDDALTFLLYFEMENYVNWETGECNYDSDSFRELLQFVSSFPTAFDWNGQYLTPSDLDEDSRLCAGLQLMKQCNFACFEDMQANTLGLGGIPCTFVGYPTENGVGSMFAQIGNSFAISSECSDKEAAWQFVRQFFLPAYQEQFLGSVFPTNLAVYEEMKQAAMAEQYVRNPDGSFLLDAEGKRVEADRGTLQVGGNQVPIRATTAEEVALTEAVIEATTHVLSTDSSLKDIIVSGAAGFFNGQRTVEETVKQIQSRSSIYVNEQR